MTAKRKQRLAVVFLILLGVGVATSLALTAFQENMLYFYDPTQILAGEAPENKKIRVGGMVVDKSVERATDSLKIKFDLTDYKNIITVQYEGILPDLFREGQGIVAIGKMQADGQFHASEVLAKHDENYMPPEVARSLEKQAKSEQENSAE
ncbi:cytochrome c maturation protein CcmE [Candidatus Albibeggiatoa sp. nov. NOAA]|uniref:cytochrome c maturation protein CcmE n=1 Tax=Candidatus Albibeggiatoa sp. nov. NOAA TaxID=3162724 RepID=UPI003303E59D|nr:cytochrome c maturation protein CcmE [Thiotrichaceae bacterium]